MEDLPKISILTPVFLPSKTVRRIVEAVTPFPFERIYGAWFNRAIARDAKAALAHSAARYIHAIQLQKRERRTAGSWWSED